QALGQLVQAGVAAAEGPAGAGLEGCQLVAVGGPAAPAPQRLPGQPLELRLPADELFRPGAGMPLQGCDRVHHKGVTLPEGRRHPPTVTVGAWFPGWRGRLRASPAALW